MQANLIIGPAPTMYHPLNEIRIVIAIDFAAITAARIYRPTWQLLSRFPRPRACRHCVDFEEEHEGARLHLRVVYLGAG